MYGSLKMDATKGCFSLLTPKSIWAKMAQKWLKNDIFSNFPLIFLMVIGEILEQYFFPTYTHQNGSLKTGIMQISASEFHSRAFHIVPCQ